jgi:post-segregation antitoxin (ccd killing protein)
LVFETATWRTDNRRHFAVVERLYEQLGLPLETRRWALSDKEHIAAALVDQVGTHLLSGSLAKACTVDAKPKERSRRAA